ncbi:DNA transformation protein TfoX1 [Dickeya dianthicola]|uniref:Competence-specific regulator n=1 Tax=Dickeya dianthicola TaxID=204039 RepID=A0AAP2D1Q6_9GAMM|nr:TfoX/Sxy family DNA transformation protein [Dickeya dianthicola]ATO34070.1 DNA transformation protein TfoX [Dickeya dianthicola RNS04.9]AYC20010.1 DNA transformation protein TfoX1 [Dickeya dianthicola]MBI0437060.1 TfoX/Sxy family DNA transformation protein [Dickeya dianthicola]MBI0448981.1 TfoX/Sxy family DNA transformation protein [Dickeya dianthicola]MBI0452021.1 TfoX/Sxy family DNA transformation protein [Dickeya dianthicola]
MKGLCEKRILQAKVVFAPLGNILSRSQFGGYSIAADGVIFALISSGELYLRAAQYNEDFFLDQQTPKLIYTKRGLPVPLNYYLVGEALWRDGPRLLELASQSLQGARQDKAAKKRCIRLKDLPNINHDLERLLWKVGIRNIDELHRLGAKTSYLKLRSVSQNLSVNVLLALAGAICGVHQAALPQGMRSELIEWFENTSPRAFRPPQLN